MTCEEQIQGVNFIGGTFVEYKDGYGTQVEFGRGIISKFHCKDDTLAIDTEDSLAAEGLALGVPYLSSNGCQIIKQPGGYWLVETGPYLGWMCAIAPKGIDIPNPKNYFANMHK